MDLDLLCIACHYFDELGLGLGLGGMGAAAAAAAAAAASAGRSQGGQGASGSAGGATPPGIPADAYSPYPGQHDRRAPAGSGPPVDPRALQDMTPEQRGEAEFNEERRQVDVYRSDNPGETTAPSPTPSMTDQAKDTFWKSFWTMGGKSPR